MISVEHERPSKPNPTELFDPVNLISEAYYFKSLIKLIKQFSWPSNLVMDPEVRKEKLCSGGGHACVI
jgi:hypothetical protein